MDYHRPRGQKEGVEEKRKRPIEEESIQELSSGQPVRLKAVLVCVCTGEPIHSAVEPRSTGEPEVLHVSQANHAPVYLCLFLWSARLLPETDKE